MLFLSIQQTFTSKSHSTYLITKPTTSATAAVSASHSGLSTGAKAGVGVGVAVGALALIALLAFLFFLMRKRRAADASQTVNALEHANSSSEPTLSLGRDEKDIRS
jgi:hypothetical protein